MLHLFDLGCIKDYAPQVQNLFSVSFVKLTKSHKSAVEEFEICCLNVSIN